jgi:hypothetical protein
LVIAVTAVMRYRIGPLGRLYGTPMILYDAPRRVK